MPKPTREFEVWVAVDEKGRHVPDVSRIDAAVRVARPEPEPAS